MKSTRSDVRKEPPVPVFGFVLQAEFPLNGLVLATEALRIANQNSGRELFRWFLISESGEPVHASNGMWMPVDCDIDSVPELDYCLIFEGNLPTQRNTGKILHYLKAIARTTTCIGAVDTGAFALEQAGLHCKNGVVLHWEAVLAFKERFPSASVQEQLYSIEDQRIHCAGGVATLDLMLDLISRLYSKRLSSEVANALVYTPRPAETPQRGDEPHKRRVAPLHHRIVRMMENNLDFPLSLEEIAQRLRVSTRTVTRICQRQFGEPPMRFYTTIRLQAARNLLFYDEFSINDIAVACGFSYTAVFSRAFRQQFGETPSAFRSKLRERQNEVYRPEIRRLTQTIWE